MRIITAFSFCTVITLLVFLYSPNNDVVMSSADIPSASQAQIDDFKLTNDFLLGVKANDPVAATPGHSEQDGTWKLLTTDKRNFAGIFNRYGTEEEVHNSYDWNLLIDPFDPFDYIYNKALENPGKTRKEWPGCIDYAKQMQHCDAKDYNSQNCMWAEISPYHIFLNTNKWFKGTHECHCHEGAFLQRGDTLAVYGFPVTDDEHGYNPEIHPAQQLWFRYKEKTNKQKDTYFLFFIQDASARFGSWVASPVYGQFLVPFRAKPSVINPLTYQPVTMTIKIAEKYDVVTKNFTAYSDDADDGYSHALVVDGKTLVIVNEGQSDEDNKALGIRFTDIVKRPDGTIQGYVQISMVLGNYDTAPVGVCVLELEVVRSKQPVIANPRPR
ncbi:MAG TPA: hypothetical protein VGO58_16630 [Chitinophagaceae bacterium]|nr:hypothetical protein [Chitinophagaceae bacterium]